MRVPSASPGLGVCAPLAWNEERGLHERLLPSGPALRVLPAPRRPCQAGEASSVRFSSRVSCSLTGP